VNFYHFRTIDDWKFADKYNQIQPDELKFYLNSDCNQLLSKVCNVSSIDTDELPMTDDDNYFQLTIKAYPHYPTTASAEHLARYAVFSDYLINFSCGH